LFVATKEEDRFLALLRHVAAGEELAVWSWSPTSGLARDGSGPQYMTTELDAALRFIADLDQPGVFVLPDGEAALHGATAIRHLKEAAQNAARGQTIIVTGPTPTVPLELSDLAHVWVLRPPSRAELVQLATRTLGDFAARGFRVDLRREDLGQLADTLAGMTLREAERAIQRTIVDDGAFTGDDIATIRSLKADLLNQDGILELIESQRAGLDDVGGLADLKRWLQVRGAVFRNEPGAAGLDAPRGVLLTGVPGCGKSLVAKTIAGAWQVPLVLLDPGRLYGKYVGESEQRLDQALRTIDAMAPAVVWIDEIEKGFATGDDSGVSRRILGTFLRWLQDRTSQVFVVATANDVSALPPELLRKGRLDETFFVDLPDASAREQILRIHLTRRGQSPSAFDIGALVGATEGFSGAELETLVVAAMYRAFGSESTLTGDDLLAEASETVPLSVSRAESIAALRAWAAARTVAA
jgi:SpoVK/Ycf46/Vps4 family AAA+-type ATPase